jgi:hypothetical protein
MANNELENLGNAAKAGLGVLARAAGLAIAATVATPIVLGVVAGVLGAGGWAIAGVAAAGFFAGGWVGKKLAANYIAKNSGPAIVVVGNLVDSVNKELTAQGGPALDIPGLTKKFDAATADTTAAAPAAAAPVVAAPAAEQKAPAQNP